MNLARFLACPCRSGLGRWWWYLWHLPRHPKPEINKCRPESLYKTFWVITYRCKNNKILIHFLKHSMNLHPTQKVTYLQTRHILLKLTSRQIQLICVGQIKGSESVRGSKIIIITSSWRIISNWAEFSRFWGSLLCTAGSSDSHFLRANFFMLFHFRRT